MTKLRKFFAISVMVMTVVAVSGMTTVTAKAAAQAGDLVKVAGQSAVYFVGSDNKLYVFPNQATYTSWYKDFSSVVTISVADLNAYGIPKGNIVVRPGTVLVKRPIPTAPAVYAVEPNGVLRHIMSEADAVALYGSNWAKRVIDLPDSFFTNYTQGTDLTTGTVPAGSLVKNSSSANVYYFDGTNYRLVSTEAALNANGFNAANVLTVTNTLTPVGTPITAVETALSYTAQGGSTGGIQPGQGTGLTVALSSMTAPSTTIINGQSIASLATFNFTASNDGPVKVTSLKLKRIGVSSDTVLSNVYLYDGNTKLTDAGSLSSGYATFADVNGVFTVAAGTTKSITVRSDISGTTGNVGMEIDAASAVNASGSMISGSFPLAGNLMSITSVTDLATVAVGSVTGSGNVNAGTMNATLWSAPLTITNKAVNLNYVSFRQIGSISADAIQNLKLYADGVQVGTASSINSENRVVFDLSAAPIKLNTGSRTLELRGDIIKGSNSTFSFSVQTAADVVLVDSNYGVNVAATGLPKTTTSASINKGTIVVQADSTFSTTQVVKNAANVTLAKYTMKAYGENMKVTTLNVVATFNNIIAATDGINDLALYVNGSQVGSTQSGLGTAATTSAFSVTKTYGTTNLFTINAGETANVEIRGTLVMNSGSTTATTIATHLQALANVYQGMTSFDTTNPTVTADYTTKTLTIVSTGLSTLSKNNAFASTQSVSSNVQKQKIGSFIFQAGSSEAVRATNVAVTLAVATMGITDVSNLYISETPATVIGNPVATPSVNNFPVDFTLQPGQTKTIDVYADVALVSDGSTLQVSDLTVSAKTATTQLTANANIAGQTLTFNAGSLSNPVNVSADAPATLMVGGTSGNAAVLKFVASNGVATVQSLKFKITNNAGTAEGTGVNSLTIGSVTAPVTYDGSNYIAFFDKTLNITVPVNTIGTKVTVVANYNTVGTNGVATRTQSKLTVTDVRYQVGNSAPVDVPSLTVGSNTMLIVAAKPIVSLSDYTYGSRVLSVGTQDVMRFKVVASSGPINFKQFSVTPLFTGLTGTTTISGVYDANDLSTNLIATPVTLTTNTVANIAFTNDEFISTEKTYVVKVTVAGLTGTVGANNLALTLTTADVLGTAVNTGDWRWNDTTSSDNGTGYLVKNLPVSGYSFSY